ncbi:HNH nuclease [Serratia phage vB_SmaS-Totoro]|nr:HNH nuclease [Serratia phage vB_SmaS-Totoro]
MRIELEFPFTEKWDYGYLVNGSDNRKRVLLYKDKKQTFGISYAKYLKSIEVKRILLPTEEVDHVDEDKENDDISNLQILTKSENIRKSQAFVRLKKIESGFYTKVKCDNPECNTELELTPAEVIRRKGKFGYSCSRSCAAKLQVLNGKASISKKGERHLPDELIAKVKSLKESGLNSKEICKITGISRSSYFRYTKYYLEE